MGLNQYSDMSEEEFFEHFNMNKIKEDQHCSATRQSVKKEESL